MYQEGDCVEYQTAHVQTENYTIPSITKTGVIEEAFFASDGITPCYWIAGETELIMADQIKN